MKGHEAAGRQSEAASSNTRFRTALAEFRPLTRRTPSMIGNGVEIDHEGEVALPAGCCKFRERYIAEAAVNMHRARAWLRLNKIFFETVSAVALAVAAISISCFQALELSQQNKLIALQTRLDEVRELPNFEFKTQAQDDGSETLTVTNTGGIPTQLSINALYNMHVSAITQPPLRSVQSTIKVLGYYPSQGGTKASKGEVAILVAPSVKRVGDIETKIRKAQTKFRAISVSGATYLDIKYRDALGGAHEQYFEVSRAYGAVDITPEQGFNDIAVANGEFEDALDFETSVANLSVEDVIKRLEIWSAKPEPEQLLP